MNRMACFFWAFWWLSACLTDISGGLAKLDLIHYPWAFAENFDYLVKCLAIYSVPVWFCTILFVGIIIWCALSSLLFFRAALQIIKKQNYTDALILAYQVSIGLWLTFFLADQIVMKFDLEQNHMVQGGFEFLTFLALTLSAPKKQVLNQMFFE